MSIEFSAALLLLEAFIQACTVVVASPEEIARNQYDAMRRELADSVTRSLTRYAHDPHIQKTINKEFKDEENYRFSSIVAMMPWCSVGEFVQYGDCGWMCLQLPPSGAVSL